MDDDAQMLYFPREYIKTDDEAVSKWEGYFFFFYMNVLLHADFVYVGFACICVCVIAFIADST